MEPSPVIRRWRILVIPFIWTQREVNKSLGKLASAMKKVPAPYVMKMLMERPFVHSIVDNLKTMVPWQPPSL